MFRFAKNSDIAESTTRYDFMSKQMHILDNAKYGRIATFFRTVFILHKEETVTMTVYIKNKAKHPELVSASLYKNKFLIFSCGNYLPEKSNAVILIR